MAAPRKSRKGKGGMRGTLGLPNDPRYDLYGCTRLDLKGFKQVVMQSFYGLNLPSAAGPCEAYLLSQKSLSGISPTSRPFITMRLLNVETLKLEEFGEDIPKYSILSHTWGEEEVTYKDLTSGNCEALKGYGKIAGCCKISLAEGYKYTWIDTCCIDKSSSAELSEAINSMFKWYNNSAICYAYLSDVHDQNPNGPDSTFSTSKWFTRGWTLQELIAPQVVIFLNSAWQEIGTKLSLGHTISQITRIDHKVFAPELNVNYIASFLQRYSIAQKMSWAALRKTARLEDQAYCLMGLFEVNMPILYGEGDKAFLRLQQQIMNQSDDCSVFAWEAQWGGNMETGLLARSPVGFANCRKVKPLTLPSSRNLSQQASFSQHAYEVSKTTLRLRVSFLGDLQKLASRTLSTLSCRHYLARRRISKEPIFESLESFRNLLFLEVRDVKNISVAMLECRSPSGRIGILLKVLENGTMLRSRLASKVFLPDVAFKLPSPTNIYCELHDPQDRVTVSIAQTNIITRLGVYDYSVSWHSANPDFRNGPENWVFGNDAAKNYLLFRSSSSQAWPPFLVAYQFKEHGAEACASCIIVDGGVTDEDAARLGRKMPMTSSRDVSEIREPLINEKQVVVKIRVKNSECDFIILIE